MGTGIPAEDLPIIFNCFHRVKKPRARNLSGSGLGLAIISELTRHLQSEIDVKSTLGEGIPFIIRLPLEAFEHPTKQSTKIRKEYVFLWNNY